MRPKTKEIIRRMAQGITEGKTQTQAARDAGLSVASADSQGSRLARTPEFEQAMAEIRRKLQTNGLGLSKTVKELKRGLRDAPLSPHGHYLDRLMRLQGLDPNPSAAPQTQTNNMLVFLESLNGSAPKPVDPIE